MYIHTQSYTVCTVYIHITYMYIYIYIHIYSTQQSIYMYVCIYIYMYMREIHIHTQCRYINKKHVLADTHTHTQRCVYVWIYVAL